MQAELEALDKALGNPKRPVCAVVGGAKVSTKLDLLGNLVGRVDKLIIGGGMANTFLQAQGIKVGKSLSREGPRQDRAARSWPRRKAAKCEVAAAGRRRGRRASSRPARRAQVVDANACPDDQMILDVGPKSIAHLRSKQVAECATLVWNGPLGAFEIKPFDTGTVALARAVAELTSARQAPVGGGRRRHGGGAGRGRRRGQVLLRLDGRRRLPGMDGRQDPARRRGADTGGVGLGGDEHAPPLPERPRLPWDPPEHFEKRIPDGDNRERLVCARCEFIHYQNPKIVAGAVCTWNDKILLGQARHRAAQGILDPAGRLHGAGRDDRAGRRNARRSEEACATIEIDRLLAMYSVARIGQVQIMYRARLVSADVAAGPESEEVALVDWADIPWEQLAFPTVVWALAHFHESRGKTDFATYSNPTGELARMWPPRKPAGV